MKIESIIVDYLYSNKELTLQGIGRFILNIEVPQSQGEKPVSFPEDAITFTEDKHAPQDEGLINHIVEITRKIKPLATSDLESFSILSKEYLNIGKPLLLEGLGTLQKNQVGDYIFTSGTYINPRLELPTETKEKEPGEISFSSPSRIDGKKNKALLIGSLILLLLLIIPGIIYYYYKKTPKPEMAQGNLSSADTTHTDKDTTVQLAPVQTITQPVAVKSDTVYLVLKTYRDSLKAAKEIDRLTSYKHAVLQKTLDSTRYAVIMPVSGYHGDTTRLKDSLNIFFGVKSYILPQ